MMFYVARRWGTAQRTQRNGEFFFGSWKNIEKSVGKITSKRDTTFNFEGFCIALFLHGLWLLDAFGCFWTFGYFWLLLASFFLSAQVGCLLMSQDQLRGTVDDSFHHIYHLDIHRSTNRLVSLVVFFQTRTRWLQLAAKVFRLPRLPTSSPHGVLYNSQRNLQRWGSGRRSVPNS